MASNNRLLPGILLNIVPHKQNNKAALRAFQFLKLYLFSCSFIAVSILVLPLTLMIQFLAVHSFKPHISFLSLLSRIYYLAKVIMYTVIELFKQIPLGVIFLVRYEHHGLWKLLFVYAYFYILCKHSFQIFKSTKKAGVKFSYLFLYTE